MPVTHDDAANTLDSVTGINGVQHGGTGADLSATGPGFLKQASLGAAVTVSNDFGSGTATTAPSGTNTTQIATTEFVQSAVPVNVLAFGADNTGTTDSVAAIEAAIDYAETVANGVIGGHGAVVRFPAGTYLISHGFDQPNRVALVGDNGFNTIIKPTADFAGTNYMVRNINMTVRYQNKALPTDPDVPLTGTVALTNGSTDIVLTGDTWDTAWGGSLRISVDGGATHFPIEKVVTPTTARLRDPWAGATTPATTYQMYTGRSTFYCFIENIHFRANHNPLITRVIEANSWNENCGIRRVQVGEFLDVGLLVQFGYGGSAGFRAEDTVFYRSNLGDGVPTTGGTGIKIDLDGITGFAYSFINSLTVYSNVDNTGFVGIEADDSLLIVEGMHAEYARAAILLHGRARLVGEGINGSPNDVVSVVELADTHATTTVGAHLVGDTTINVTSTAGFPSTGYLYMGGELLSYTNKTATSFLGCVRGVESSDRVAPSAGTAVVSGWGGRATLSACEKGGATNLVLRNTGANGGHVITDRNLSGRALSTGIASSATFTPNLNRARTHIANIASTAAKTVEPPTGDIMPGDTFVIGIRNDGVASVSVTFNAAYKTNGYTDPATNKVTFAMFRYITGTGVASLDGSWWQVGPWSGDL